MEFLDEGREIIKTINNQKKKKPYPWYDVMREYFTSLVVFPKTYSLSLMMRKNRQSETRNHYSIRTLDQDS